MNKMLRNLHYSVASAGLLAMSLAQSAFANSFAGEQPNIDGLPDATGTDLREWIVEIVQIVLNFVGLIAVIIIIIGGIRLIVSQGEEEQKDKAKKTILYAVIGLIVVLFAKIIVSLVTVYLYEEIKP